MGCSYRVSFSYRSITFCVWADSQGEDAYNQQLSQARSEAVVAYWKSKFPGIPAGNIVPKGYGESKPVATNDTPDGRQQNRRVEITVLNPEVLR